MRRPLRMAAAGGLAIIGAGATMTVLPARAAPNTYTIGVDNASPTGHNFQYVDYFPRDTVNVLNNSDVVDFKWNQGSADGFHTVTFLKTGDPVPGFAIPDGDDSPAALQVNGAAFGPAFGSGGPCGASSATACTYDGNATVSSGAKPTAPGNDFFVKFNLSAPTTITYHCLVHPAMLGQLTITAAGDSLTSAVDAAALAQYNATTVAALAKEQATNNSSVTTNPNGTHTLTMTAGTAVQYVEILEMLPNNVSVQAADSVRWNTTTITDIHTVTFPAGAGSQSVDPFLPPVCEANPADTPAPGGPPTFGCSPGAAELPLQPQAIGPTAISSPSTVATAGILAGGPTPFPAGYTFSFPNGGSFPYQCRIHDHMTGLVVVSAAATIPIPATGGGRVAVVAPRRSSPGLSVPLLSVLIVLFALGAGVGLVRRRNPSAP